MPEETHQPTKQPGGWSAARQHLATWGKPALLALVKDLYDAAAAIVCRAWTRSLPLVQPLRAFGCTEFLSPLPKRLKSAL